ncbi:putative phloem protein [Helianthus annuus]|nr:putative phloem protein [Helianthus annuus]KAJ0638973.1 putative phloem protein [Helianthus annuus]KAJ0784961.1 putative phloem protein [Helianthus annuus]KAJ0794220.1 putative phloem protein [Helianthus annuus]
MFRFKKVPLMMDISNLKIQAHIKAQLLTPNAIYGVYLVFIIVEPNKISSEPKYKYVNLKYKMKDETLHAYLATWRKDKWMMVELYRFLNDKDDVNFEVLLESFSRYYCGSGPIYIEGIEFRAIDNLFLATEMNGKQRLMLSAKAVLYDSSNVKLFRLKPSEQSRFGDVIEVLSQPVVRIKCKIDELYLSPDIYYRCYLIFKLSEKCRGLHCPVKVRGPLHRSNKVIKNLYLRSPNAWNIHDIDQVPKQREDGWMEVNVWTFKTKDVQRMFQGISVNLKLISYEGTMSGLIVCGLEFRPM